MYNVYFWLLLDVVGLGEDLQLRIEIDEQSAFGLFARYVVQAFRRKQNRALGGIYTWNRDGRSCLNYICNDKTNKDTKKIDAKLIFTLTFLFPMLITNSQCFLFWRPRNLHYKGIPVIYLALTFIPKETILFLLFYLRNLPTFFLCSPEPTYLPSIIP